jgi:hypothetical protein
MVFEDIGPGASFDVVVWVEWNAESPRRLTLQLGRTDEHGEHWDRSVVVSADERPDLPPIARRR